MRARVENPTETAPIRSATMRTGSRNLRIDAQLDTVLRGSLEPEVKIDRHLQDRAEFTAAQRLGHAGCERRNAVAEVAEMQCVNA